MIEQIEEIVIQGVVASDYPDFSDAYVASARWKNTGETLTELEMLALERDEDYSMLVNKEAHEVFINQTAI